MFSYRASVHALMLWLLCVASFFALVYSWCYTLAPFPSHFLPPPWQLHNIHPTVVRLWCVKIFNIYVNCDTNTECSARSITVAHFHGVRCRTQRVPEPIFARFVCAHASCSQRLIYCAHPITIIASSFWPRPNA